MERVIAFRVVRNEDDTTAGYVRWGRNGIELVPTLERASQEILPPSTSDSIIDSELMTLGPQVEAELKDAKLLADSFRLHAVLLNGLSWVSNARYSFEVPVVNENARDLNDTFFMGSIHDWRLPDEDELTEETKKPIMVRVEKHLGQAIDAVFTKPGGEEVRVTMEADKGQIFIRTYTHEHDEPQDRIHL